MKLSFPRKDCLPNKSEVLKLKAFCERLNGFSCRENLLSLSRFVVVKFGRKFFRSGKGLDLQTGFERTLSSSKFQICRDLATIKVWEIQGSFII